MTDGAISAIFANAADFDRRKLQCCGHTLYIYYIDGLISGSDVSELVVKPVAEHLEGSTMHTLYRNSLEGGIYNVAATPCKDVRDAASKLVNGFAVVLFPDVGAIAFEARTGEKRGISAPEVENTVKGPKDAFVETLRSNTSLIRRHLRAPELGIYETAVGRRSLTGVAVVWAEGITNPELVSRMKQRLTEIDVDGLLSPAAVEEYVTGSRKTAFPMLQYTERPDKFCHGILDGRVGLLVDGLPLGYLAPVNLGYLMDSPEDRSRDYLSASAIRVLRYVALVISLLLPGFYIAMVTFHQNWIPERLLRIILESRADIPFHAVTEALSLLIAYELLQESGIHLPQAVGQSVSTIGGIVVGTAAVEAGLISPVVLVAVSVAGVCGFVLPNRDLAQAVRLWRFVLGILAGVAGIWGMLAGIAWMLIRLSSLKSLGIRYLSLRSGPGKSILRPQLKNQKYRNLSLHPKDKKNQK